MSIHRSSNVSIGGQNRLTNVGRDQYNNSNNRTIINKRTTIRMVATKSTKTTKQCTKYDEFKAIKRGDIIVVKDVHVEDFRDWEPVSWDSDEYRPVRECKRTIQTVQVYPDQQSKFTALVYEGDSEGARSRWEEDFRQFSGTRNATSFQLFGLNRSEVPMLIFHDELIPLRHFYSFWNEIYILHLRFNLDCHSSNLWMNAQGTFCGGPEGSRFDLPYACPDWSILVPPTINMLEGDTSFLFLAKRRSKMLDQCIFNYAWWQWIPTHLDDLFPNLEMSEDYDSAIHDQSNRIIRNFFRKTPKELPMEVLGSLRFDTVYSSSLEPIARCPEGRNLLWKVGRCVPKTLVGDGWTRCAAEMLFESPWADPHGDITLYGKYGFDRDGSETLGDAWLAQSSRVTSVLGITEMDSAMILTRPSLVLKSKPRSDQYAGLVAFFKLCNGEEPPPVYLCIHPPPTCISELISWEDGTTQAYFWSFDETGQTCLSEDECEEWGIPELTLECWRPDLRRWPTEVYQALHDWQVVQGFDPTTADFARHLGLPELEILGTPKKTESRFEEIREEETDKNLHASVGVQTEARRASKKKAEIPCKSAVRPQSRSVEIASSFMEEATRSELADGDARRLSNSLWVGWKVAVAILCVIFVQNYIH